MIERQLHRHLDAVPERPGDERSGLAVYGCANEGARLNNRFEDRADGNGTIGLLDFDFDHVSSPGGPDPDSSVGHGQVADLEMVPRDRQDGPQPDAAAAGIRVGAEDVQDEPEDGAGDGVRVHRIACDEAACCVPGRRRGTGQVGWLGVVELTAGMIVTGPCANHRGQLSVRVGRQARDDIAGDRGLAGGQGGDGQANAWIAHEVVRRALEASGGPTVKAVYEAVGRCEVRRGRYRDSVEAVDGGPDEAVATRLGGAEGQAVAVAAAERCVAGEESAVRVAGGVEGRGEVVAFSESARDDKTHGCRPQRQCGRASESGIGRVNGEACVAV